MPRPRRISDDRLLEVSRARFVADGVGASTRDIASDAGVSEGVLFQRFGTKEELFFRAMRLPPPDLEHSVRRAMRAKTRQQGLLTIALATLEYLRDAVPVLLLVISHPASRDRLKQGSHTAQYLLEEAFGIRGAFQVYLESRGDGGRIQADDASSMIGILIPVLLVRAMHEQFGISDPKETKAWLRATLRSLDRGWPDPGA